MPAPTERYNVSGQPFDSGDETDEETDLRRGRGADEARTWKDALQSWAWSALWLAGCGAVVMKSDVVGVLLYSRALWTLPLYLSYVFEAVVLFGGVWLTYRVHPDEFNTVHIDFLPKRPKAIPFITFFWVLGSFLFALGVWPVYHVMTLPLMFALFMGFVHALNFLPTRKKPSKKTKRPQAPPPAEARTHTHTMPPPPTANVQRFSANPAAPQPRPAYVAPSMHTVPSVQAQPAGDGYQREAQPAPMRGASGIPPQAATWGGRPQTSDGPGSRGGSATLRGEQHEREQQFSKTFTSGDAGDLLAALPSNIRASLKTFEELQLQKNHLLTSSTRLAASQKAPLTPPIVNGKTHARSSSTGRMGPLAEAREASRKEKEFQKKLELSESVMKKLHKRNQKLSKEVATLKDELEVACKQTGHVPAAAPAADASSGASAAALAQKDDRIRELEARVRALEGQPPRRGGGGGDDGAASVAHQHLQQQYTELLNSHIDSVTNSVSTSKINSEVKAFFVTLRKKIHTDLVDREVERGVWNEKMADLEERLCEQYAQNKLAQV